MWDFDYRQSRGQLRVVLSACPAMGAVGGGRSELYTLMFGVHRGCRFNDSATMEVFEV